MKSPILILLVSSIFLTTNTAYAEQTTNSLEVGISKTKLGLLLQNWVIYDAKSTQSKSNFKLRRAEIKFSGTVQENSSFVIMIDPAKSLKMGAVAPTNDNKVLQDFILNYNLNDKIELSVGQFKIPATAEGLISASNLILPERSVVGRTYGDKRDIGIKSTLKQDNYKLAFMISSGSKTNAEDNNSSKDLYLRGDYTPLKDLSLGGFTGLVDSKSSQFKWGINLFWDTNPESIHFEYVGEESSITPNVKKSNGYMIDLGYLLDPSLQLVIRYERLLFNRITRIESKSTTLGINYFLKNSNSKIQFATSFLNNMNANNGSYDVAAIDQKSAILNVLNFQMGF